MKKSKMFLAGLALLSLGAAGLAPRAGAASTRSSLEERLDAATAVINEVMSTPDKSIPDGIARQATCIGVVPGLKKGAFVLGGQYGQGVVSCRTGHGWSAPVFFRLAGASFGFQIGGQSTDLILVAVNQKGFEDMLKSKVKLGGDAAAAAGPVGRTAQAGTDWKLSAELLTYSRSKGLFAGIDLSGDDLSQNVEDTRAFYDGGNYTFEQILKGDVAVPDPAKPFVRTVAKYFHAAQEDRN